MGATRVEPGQAHVFNLEDVTRHDLGRLNLGETTVAQHDGLERQRLLELLDNGPGLEFLHEADGSVEQEQGADDAKVDPVLETGGENGGGLGCITKRSAHLKISRMAFTPN